MKTISIFFTYLFLLNVSLNAQNESNLATDKEKSSTVSSVTMSLQNISMAENLADFGLKYHSVTALVTAAQIIHDNQTVTVKNNKTNEKIDSIPTLVDNKPKNSNTKYNPQDLIALAKKYAKNNKTLESLVLETEIKLKQPVAQRGALNGPKEQIESVNARSSDSYVVAFKGLESAEVYVKGDCDTDIDLYIYDENGNLIESDTDGTCVCYVKWTPKWTGNYRIKVVNLGYVYSYYKILTN